MICELYSSSHLSRTFPLEELVEVGDVLPEKVEGVGVVVLHRLRDVDDVSLASVEQYVVFA